MKKLILIDGNSIAFRAFYGLPLLSNQSGLHTNAIFGYARLLERIIKDEQPTHFLVAFDAGKSTFRHKEYKDYKGGRQKTPPELGEQFAPIRNLIDAYGIKRYEAEEYEADDIIGTLARQADAEAIETIVITGDKDLTQLATDNVTIYYTKKGISDVDKITPQFIREDMNITPEQIIDLKGLMGDKSDNIPGVPGVGEKTALKLLHEYGTVENVLDNIENITGKKLNENLVTYQEDARMSKHLATIYTEVPMDFTIDDLAFSNENTEAKYEIFKEFEFKSLLENMEATSVEEKVEFNTVLTEDLSELGPRVSVYLEALGENYLKTPPAYVAITDGENTFVQSIDALDKERFNQFLNEREEVWTYDIKRNICLLNHLDINFSDYTEDIMLSAFLIDPSIKIVGVAEVVEPFGININSDAFFYGKGRNKKNPTHEEYVDFLQDKIMGIHLAKEKLSEKIESYEMHDLLHDLEIPLTKVLAQMELRGIHVDRTRLEEMEQEIQGRLDEIEANIHKLAGEEFNINSTKQLGVILFEKLKLPVIKRTKTGYSTAVDVLEALEGKHDIITYLLEYRTLSKLQSTYVIGLQSEVTDAGKIHTRFNQTLAQTGRLSSVEPNLQNIPIRIDEGRKIRQAFVPKSEDYVLVALDYSQIELRVLAHISGDESMQEAFNTDSDIHTRTASEVFGVNEEDVDAEMRRNAKAVNFGIVYGISDYGLSQNLHITRKEARTFIDNYLASFPKVDAFMKSIVQDARRDGYVSTIMKRRRYVPDIHSKNFNQRNFAERIAMNSPIQGSAADIIKKAMVDYVSNPDSKQFDASLLLQIHDELIFEVNKDDVEKFIPHIQNIMENTVKLDVDLKVDYGQGKNWYEVK